MHLPLRPPTLPTPLKPPLAAHIQAVVVRIETEAGPRIPLNITDKIPNLDHLVVQELAEAVGEDEVKPETRPHLQEQSRLKHPRTAAQGGHLEAASVLA